MSKTTVFTGAATAAITPFRDGRVDFEAYGKFVDWQIESGIDAIVAAGTTGEGSTLTDDEHREVIKCTVERVAGRVPVIAGTGSNDTDYAISLTKFACEVGADACLVVTPYYNKATQRGLIRLFGEIADVSTKPIILYNVPSRTGVNIEPSTYEALADHPMITGIKEAGGDISKIAQTARLVAGKLDIWSGNDDQIVPIMSLGGKGVISVLSNVAPSQTSSMCKKYLAGDVKGSLEIQLELLPLIGALFCEVNPTPVKAACAAMGFCENSLRSPLYPMEEANRERMLGIMRGLGLLER